MADEIENHTVRLLQEMRAEMRAQAEATRALAEEVADMRTDLTVRIDGNTVLFNMVAGMLHNHDERIGKLEQDRA